METPDGPDGREPARGVGGLDEALRVRGERSARFLARQVPPDARVVGLVYASLGAGRTAHATLELADALAIRRDHTLLAGLESGEDSLDGILGGGTADGLVDVLRGRNRLTEVAIRDPERPWVYLPAGRNARPAPELVQLEAFRRFADRVRERGGTLLLHLPREALPVASAGGLLDGYVSLGRVEEVAAGAREFGRVVFPEEDEGENGDGLRAEDGGPGREEGDLRMAGAGAGPEASDPGPEAGDPGGEAGDSRMEDADAGAPAAAVPTESPPGPFAPAPPERPAAPAPSAPAPSAAARPRAPREPPAPPEPSVASRPSAPESSAAPPPSGRAAPAAGTDGGPKPAAWARHRKPGSLPVVRIAVGVAVLAALGLGWWLLARSLAPAGAEGPESEDASAAGVEAGTAGSGATGSEAPAEGSAPAASGTAAARPAPTAAASEAPELPYSVLIASYAARADAVDRLRELEGGAAAAGGLFSLSPTPVRGAIYHRVFAGARADTAGAARLMQRLVGEGLKERTHPWDVRPVRLAFRLGVYGSRRAAVAQREAAERAGIPAYVVAAPMEGDTAFQLYAGAYESEAAARPMLALLEAADREGELMERRGEPR